MVYIYKVPGIDGYLVLSYHIANIFLKFIIRLYTVNYYDSTIISQTCHCITDVQLYNK